jgi:hypothetical protein
MTLKKINAMSSLVIFTLGEISGSHGGVNENDRLL